ncbi:methyltransferase domain-containing protein [Nocardioides guangzhouensis]|uniref:Methyltransferase domain-containing protein n=1 Tax=Nocardioides guangzhouensis TaxID=2497878 RepID=A0A4Q4Z4U0_9ACTN|nr:methyltransferase domain-containing protein [Nocardioides guangzhouensis]RYP82438.1 methyltransferase domain-containing protein [Nocardioides guangzhouensis]
MAERLSGDRSLAQRAMQSRLLAPVYERAWRPFLGWALMGFDLEHLRHERELTVTALRLRPGDVVLDVACGPGNFTHAFAEAVAPTGHAIGVDLSEPMLARARATNARARARATNAHRSATYLRGDATRLPFLDGSLDAVNCYAALYLIPAPYDAFDEMLRVLRPGGRIALMTSRASPYDWFRPAQARASGRRGCGCSASTSSPAGCAPPGSPRSSRSCTGSRSTSPPPPRSPDPPPDLYRTPQL